MLTVAVIRHAIAQDRLEAERRGVSDADRPLTASGRKRMLRAAWGLRRLIPAFDVLATSPLLRAVETAMIVADAFGGPGPTKTSALEPDAAPEALAEWFASVPDGAAVGVVGHEPHLSGWVGWAVTGEAESWLELKKGAVCLLEFPRTPAAGEGTLCWALQPRHLRWLGQES